MGLDIRLPIGMMFTLIGLLLAVSGFLSKDDVAKYQCSLGININLIWGIVLLVFGSLMLSLALIARNAAPAQSAQPEKEPALR